MYDASKDALLHEFNRLIVEKDCVLAPDQSLQTLKTGVDLGTANIVLAVVDAENRPVAGALYPSSVVRDGIVVDYVGAISAVQRLKAELEERLGGQLLYAAAAIPPGVHPGSIKAIGNIVESAGFEIMDVSDEPTAAARVLHVREGAVVDVGGGTTGISILKDGEVIFTYDEATGGTHMSLVLAGARGISFEEAEELKKDHSAERQVFPIIQPVVEKMASIVSRCLKDYPVDTIYIVGGACSFSDFEKVFEKNTGIRTIKPSQPLLVTPLGIAMYSPVGAGSGR